MSSEARQIVGGLGDWYLNAHVVYIRIYGATISMHVFQFYMTHRMVLSEIIYQSFECGMVVVLSRRKKTTWPRLPIRVGACKINKNK